MEENPKRKCDVFFFSSSRLTNHSGSDVKSEKRSTIYLKVSTNPFLRTYNLFDLKIYYFYAVFRTIE